MKVRVVNEAKVHHDGRDYTEGDVLELEDEYLEIMLTAGAVEEVKE